MMADMQMNPSDESIPKVPSPSFLSGSSVPEAVHNICSVEIQKFEEMLPVALAGSEIEGVHKVRVALRRVRTCIKFGKPFFHQTAIPPQLDELKRIANLFGSIRDLDVLKLNFSTFHTQQYQQDNFETLIWNPLFGNLYNTKYSQLVKEADTNAIKYLGPNLLRVLEENRLMKQDHPPGYPDTAGHYLASKLTKKISVITNVDLSGSHRDDLSRLHRLRLKAKTFRYLLEFFESLLDAEAANRLVQTMILFQDHLGEINDTVVAQDFLRAQPETKLASPSTTAIDDYLDFLKREQSRLVSQFEEIWQDFIQAQPALILEDALAPLAHL